MPEELQVTRVEASFDLLGGAPAQQVQRASGVSEVETDGSILRCLVCGSFQPFLEALRGHQVVGFSSTAALVGETSSAPTTGTPECRPSKPGDSRAQVLRRHWPVRRP